MFFIGGGGGGGFGGLGGRFRGQYPPAQRKTPFKPPPPKPPPFLNLALGGVLSMISDFRESRPPWRGAKATCRATQDLLSQTRDALQTPGPDPDKLERS